MTNSGSSPWLSLSRRSNTFKFGAYPWLRVARLPENLQGHHRKSFFGYDLIHKLWHPSAKQPDGSPTPPSPCVQGAVLPLIPSYNCSCRVDLAISWHRGVHRSLPGPGEPTCSETGAQPATGAEAHVGLLCVGSEEMKKAPQ